MVLGLPTTTVARRRIVGSVDLPTATVVPGEPVRSIEDTPQRGDLSRNGTGLLGASSVTLQRGDGKSGQGPREGSWSRYRIYGPGFIHVPPQNRSTSRGGTNAPVRQSADPRLQRQGGRGHWRSQRHWPGLDRSLCREGMRVVMTDIDEHGINGPCATIGDAVRPLVSDVRDQGSVERAGQLALETFGALHVAVNNAGIVNGGILLGAVARGVASRHRHEPLGRDPRRAGLRAADPATGRGGSCRQHRFDGCRLGAPTVSGHTPWRSTACSGSATSCGPSWRRSSAPIGVSVVMPGMIRTGMNPVGMVEPPSVARTCSTPSGRGRPYVFTDDHSTKQVEAACGRFWRRGRSAGVTAASNARGGYAAVSSAPGST